MNIDRDAVKAFLTDLQERIVTALEQVDGHTFMRDAWQRPEGGEGLSCVIEEGKVFERVASTSPTYADKNCQPAPRSNALN